MPSPVLTSSKRFWRDAASAARRAQDHIDSRIFDSEVKQVFGRACLFPVARNGRIDLGESRRGSFSRVRRPADRCSRGWEADSLPARRDRWGRVRGWHVRCVTPSHEILRCPHSSGCVSMRPAARDGANLDHDKRRPLPERDHLADPLLPAMCRDTGRADSRVGRSAILDHVGQRSIGSGGEPGSSLRRGGAADRDRKPRLDRWIAGSDRIAWHLRASDP